MSRMTDPDRWYFSRDKISNSPSRQCGLDEEKEISNRQSAANFIQEMGQRLQVTQLCINTAIVYMHRFYMFHSFTKFHRNAISACALFLAAKVEEQPRKLEHVIKIAHWCLNIKTNKGGQQIDVRSPEYIRQANELVINENIMLQTLGFEIGIEHPHTSVVKCCQLVKAHKDLAQTSYFMATSSLHLTTMCLQYKPTIVACFCIHIACKWDNWEIPVSSEGKPWFCYVDETVTEELLENLTSEFLFRFEKLLDRLKRKSGSRGSLNHRSLPPPNDKKIPSSSSQVQDLDAKRSINNKQLPNDKLNQQASSTSRSTTESSSLSLNHSLPNSNAVGNGPINKTRIIDQINHKPIDVNKQSKDLHYNMMNRDKQKELIDKKPPQIKSEFNNNNSNRDYNSTIKTNQSSTSSTINKYDNKLNSNMPTLSRESLSNKDSKFAINNSGIDLNDKNNNKNSHIQKQLPPSQQQQQNKQQQIQLEKQRQQEERNKHRPRNQDYLWNDTNKLVHNNSGTNKPQLNSTSSSILPNNMFTNNSSSNNSSTSINHSFLDNLISNSSIYNSNSNSSNDNNSLSKSPKLNWDQSLGNNEDSFDPKKDLKMEFSDNSDNSNQSGVNLNSLPSLFMNDNMINGQMESTNSSTNSNSNNTKTNTTTNLTMKNSFMSIFKNEDSSSNNNNNKMNQNIVKSPLNTGFNLTNNALNSNLVSNKSSLSSLNNLSNSSLNHHSLLPQQATVLNSTLQQQSSSTSLNSNLSTKLSSSSNHSSSNLTNSLPNSILPTNQISANSNSGNLIHQSNNSSLLSSQSFLMQSTLPGANNGFNPTTASLNVKQENQIVNSTAPIQDNHLYNNSLSTLQLSNSFANNSYTSSSTNNLEHSSTLEMLGEYHHKSKSKKDKDREKHKKHKSKDKHKKDKHKDKSKDKERSSSKHSSKEDKYSAVELDRQAPTKLIIKKDRIDDNSSNGDEKPIEKLKLVIPKNLISNYPSGDRKRKHSPKDKERSKQIKLE